MKHLLRFFLFLSLILVGGLLLTGCQQGECRRDTDCNEQPQDNLCTKDVCNTAAKTCMHVAIPACNCGDLVCDNNLGERCNCSYDCASQPCIGTFGQLMAYQCDAGTQKCVLGVKEGLLKKESFTSILSVSSSAPSLKVTLNYETPLNIDTTPLMVTIQPDIFPQHIEQLTIRSIEVFERISGEQIRSYAQRSLDRVLWDSTSKIEESIPLSMQDVASSSNKSATKRLNIRLVYDYMSKGELRTQVQDVSIGKVVVVAPGETAGCKRCVSTNPCEVAVCGEETNYFCEYRKKPECCGNYACEAGENQCSCPVDCGQCSRATGDYLSYACSAGSCISFLKEKAIPKTLVETKLYLGVSLLVKVSYEEPIQTGFSTVELSLTPSASATATYPTAILVKRVELLSGDQLIAEQTPATQLAVDEATILSLPIAYPLSLPEQRIDNIRLKAYLQMTDSEGRVQDIEYSKNIGRILFVKVGV
ncbi:hypothetical protein HZB02_03215 [Candidatus Woesearchaeota archaeon]|nr:hypothetical protein [Candidatus Woesearchaeota archaeon]